MIICVCAYQVWVQSIHVHPLWTGATIDLHNAALLEFTSACHVQTPIIADPQLIWLSQDIVYAIGMEDKFFLERFICFHDQDYLRRLNKFPQGYLDNISSYKQGSHVFPRGALGPYFLPQVNGILHI